jgi:threonine/homoserine/homoserine lactone efflux protein
MTADTLLSLVLFCLVSSITPGPNNVMLLASGVNFGFRRTIPNMAGINAGFAAMLLAVGFGLGGLLKAIPALDLALKIAGGGYLLYLSWRIASARSLGESGESGTRPLSFAGAAAFQFVNPKAWVTAVAAMAIYTDSERYLFSVFLIAAIFSVVNLPCIAAWAGFGVAMRNWLADPVRLKWFNIAMGLTLAATLYPMLT